MKDNKYQKLGRGLSELLKTDLPDQVEALQKDSSLKRFEIAVNQINPNPFQPRQVFDKSKLEELADSIKLHGVLTPILVRALNDKFQIVAGERRYRATLIAGLKTIPAVVANFNDNQMMEIALIENIQRQDLSVIEEARAFANIQKTFNVTQEQVGKRLGKSRSYIANLTRLLTLPISVQDMLATSELTMGHARTLVGLSNQEIEHLAKEMVVKKLNVRQAETLVNLHKKGQPKSYFKYQKILSDKFKRKIVISGKTIKIPFKNEEDLVQLIKEWEN
jgi:ParB family transcriptional regulator, chromosome partitioning protein